MGLSVDLANVDHIDFGEVDGDLKKLQEDKIVQEALRKGVDLGNYARQIEDALLETEAASIADYLREGASVAGLHNEIKSCDSVLARMQDMLSTFQSNLGAISSEIKHLQDKSMSMRVKLKNRKAVHKDLDTHVKSIFVSPALIQTIHEAEIKEPYINSLIELDVKIKYLADLKREGQLSPAARDMAPLCQRTATKAVARIRGFLLQRIFMLKKPQTNIQIKQNLLLRYRYLFRFLQMHAPETATEIRDAYVDTVRKIYTAHFRQYLGNLMRLQAPTVASRGDVLAADEKKSGGLFSLRKSKMHLMRVFMLGNRHAILSNINKPPIICHHAAKRNHKYPYQEIFRTTHRMLMDTATTEAGFLIEFFEQSTAATSAGDEAKSDDAKRDGDAKADGGETARKRESQLFDAILGPTEQLFAENLNAYLSRSYDCLELLILIRIVALHSRIMKQRQTSCLDGFFDRINMVLWPRFKAVLDAHLASITKMKVSASRTASTDPHYISSRYAEFASGVELLNEDCGGIIDFNMGRLRDAVIKLMGRLAVRLGEERAQMVYLINNYDSVLKVFGDKSISSETTQQFKDLQAAQVTKYVEMELSEKFGPLIEFVRGAEAKVAGAVEAGDGKMPSLDLDGAAGIVRSFAKTWQKKLGQIDARVSGHFAPTKGSANVKHKADIILKQILIQLVLYYKRFQDVIKKCYRRAPSFMKELVPIPNIMHEIKKYGSRH